MKKKVWLSLLIIMLAAANLYSQDWTQFRGTERNGKVTGFKAPSLWPGQLTRVWQVNVGTCDASPVLSGGKIYMHTRQGNDEVVICIEADSGKEIWKYSYSSPAVTGPATSHPGPRSTPVVSGGKIVTMGVAGTVSCIDASSGKPIWQKEDTLFPDPQFFTGMSPIVTEGMCIVQQGTRDDGHVIAYDLNTGKEKWRYSGEGPAYGSPSLLTYEKSKQLVVITEKSLLALNPADGRLLWKTDAICQQRFYNSSSPVIDGTKIFISGSGTGIRALKITKEGSQFKVTELWKNTEVGTKWNTPVLKDGYLYGFSDQKRIFCVDAATGKTAWKDDAVHSDFATIIDCGPVLAGLPSTGNLLIIKPDPKSYAEIARYKVADTPVYAFPLIAGKTIYVKDAETLTMYRIE